MKGTINTRKDSFGFIKGDDGKSYFFIPSCLKREGGLIPPSFDDFLEGRNVRFAPVSTDKGLRATEVELELAIVVTGRGGVV